MKMTASYRFGVLSEFNKDLNKVPIYFFVDGKFNTEMRGSNGTGVKFYDTFQKAKAAGERYLKTMEKLGFEIERR